MKKRFVLAYKLSHDDTRWLESAWETNDPREALETARGYRHMELYCVIDRETNEPLQVSKPRDTIAA